VALDHLPVALTMFTGSGRNRQSFRQKQTFLFGWCSTGAAAAERELKCREELGT